MYTKYTVTISESYPSGSGFDVLSDCEVEPEIVTTLKIREDSRNTWVDVAILNYRQIETGCTLFRFVLPGEITNFGYQLPEAEKMHPKNIPPNWRPKWEPVERMYRSPFRYDVVTLVKSDYPKFIGQVSFLWVDRLAIISYGERKLTVPLFAPIDLAAEEKLTRVKRLLVHVSMPSDAVMKDQSHQLTGRKLITTYSLYSFEVDRKNSVLEFTVQFPKLLVW